MRHLLMKSDKSLEGGTADETGRDLRQISWLKRSDGFHLELEEKSLRATLCCYFVLRACSVFLGPTNHKEDEEMRYIHLGHDKTIQKKAISNSIN